MGSAKWRGHSLNNGVDVDFIVPYFPKVPLISSVFTGSAFPSAFASAGVNISGWTWFSCITANDTRYYHLQRFLDSGFNIFRVDEWGDDTFTFEDGSTMVISHRGNSSPYSWDIKWLKPDDSVFSSIAGAGGYKVMTMPVMYSNDRETTPIYAVQTGQYDIHDTSLTMRVGSTSATLDSTLPRWSQLLQRTWYPAYYDPPIIGGDDPYTEGGTVDDSRGGGGSFDFDSDPISFPTFDEGVESQEITPPEELPTLSAVNSGFITLFEPTNAQLNQLASYMWGTSGLNVDNFKKVFADPMDAILGLSILPVQATAGGMKEVHVGNISTGIQMPYATTQYVGLSCGSISIPEVWKGYLDYSPYTTIDIYLPYIGIKRLNTDDIMGKTISVLYNIDILSGGCIAMISVDGSVLYSFAGQCATSIPITGHDWTNVLTGALSVATTVAGVATTVATSGASAGAIVAGASGVIGGGMTASKQIIERSGAVSGSAGLLGIQVPYLIMNRPKQALADGQASLEGYPSHITATLANLSGFTQVESIKLSGVSATGDELSEIESLLRTGVYL